MSQGERLEKMNKGRFWGSRISAFIILMISNVFWGLSSVLTKLALQAAEPEYVLLFRFAVAFFTLNIIAVIRKEKVRLKGKPLGILLLLVMCDPFYYIINSYGIHYSNATLAGAVFSVTPIISMLLAILFLREYPSPKKILYSFMPVAGVWLVTINGSRLGTIRMLGLILLLFSCLFSSSYRVFNKKASLNYSAFERTYYVIGTCFVFYLISALFKAKGDMRQIYTPLTNPAFCIPTFAMGILGSSIGALGTNYAAGIISVLEIASMSTIITVFSLFSGIIFLKEPINLEILLGCLLIIIGIRLVVKSDKSEQETQQR